MTTRAREWELGIEKIDGLSTSFGATEIWFSQENQLKGDYPVKIVFTFCHSAHTCVMQVELVLVATTRLIPLYLIQSTLSYPTHLY